MSILDRVYTTRREFDELFFKAQAEWEETGKVSEETQAKIDVAKEHREDVVSDLCVWFMKEQAKLSGLKAVYDPIRDDMKREEEAHKKTMEVIKEQIKVVLPPSPEAQIANDRAYCYYRESESVEVINALQLPTDLYDTELVIKPKVDAIKDALRNKQQVNGAVLHVNFNPQIKVGGAAAIKNARNRLKRQDLSS